MWQNWFKKIIIFILFVFLFFPFLGQRNKIAFAASPLAVSDYTNEALNTIQNVFDKMWQAWQKWESAHKEAMKHATEIAYKAALHNFLQKLAIDTATWVASGGHGQKPMFITQGWGTYLNNAADQAAGTFILTWASSYGNQELRKTKGSAYQQAVTQVSLNYNKCITNCANSYLNISSPNQTAYGKCIQDCLDTANESQREITQKFYKGETAGTAGRAYGNGIASNIANFICQPNLNLRLKLSAGLANIENPAPPLCTYSKAKKNWQRFLNSKDFLNKFSAYWNPSENDLGITLTMHSSFLASRQAGMNAAELSRQEGGGWKAVTDLAGKILTPATMVKEMGYKPIEEGTSLEKIDTHDIVANAIATFASTLMGKLLNKWIMKGLIHSGGNSAEFDWSNFLQSNNLAAAVQQKENQKLVQDKFVNIFQTKFNKGKAYSILSKLVLCPDPNNPGPTDCVIDNNFAQAVQQHLTVEQAIKDGYINKNLPFGFYANGFQPRYNEGYPYRSLVILRKYRIIPVGWEIAALYIGKILAHSDHPRTYNIQEIIDHYNDPSSPFYKLIDPNWVLKAPEVYCAREAYGDQLLDKEVASGIDVDGDGKYDGPDDIPPRLTIARAKYCADEQSCIKTDAKGNCLFYGYCTKEKRIWNFQGDKCDSQYNTCQTFTNPAGQLVSYLKRSLDFSDCNAQNAGCRWYCQWRNPEDDTWMCKAPGIDLRTSDICLNPKGCVLHDTYDLDQNGNTTESCTVPYRGMSCRLKSGARLVMQPYKTVVRKDNAIYLNEQTPSCPAEEAGCHEFYRAKEGLGTNLLVNSSFEATTSASFLPGWTTVNGKQVIGGFAGNYAFGVSAIGSLKQTIETGRSIGGRKFVFSFYAKNCSSATTFQIVGSSKIKNLKSSSQWQRFSMAYMFAPTVSSTKVAVQIVNIQPGCLIDAVQLEEVPGNVNQPSQYKDYGSANVIYLKKAPEYYHCDKYTKIVSAYTDKTSCLAAGHFWRADIQKCVQGGSAQCAHFALECSLYDVGCNLYTPTNGDPAIPAVVHSDDYCPAQCAGYNSYKQVATFFTQEKFPEFFIPQYEKSCSVQFAGCSEFTNLDKLKEGGEAVEDFTYLRPCHKIDGDCATFYTWVGSDITGYQLKSYSLVDANHDGIPDTIYSINEAKKLFGSCSSDNDVLTNPECYKFYSTTGKISYIQYKNTIACSNDCHPFRKTISTKADCTASHGKWLSDGHCVYEGLESQSIRCPASQVGCYEFKGNTSANIFRVIDDTFENGINNWSAGIISPESLVKGGHSLKVTAGTNLSYELKDACVLASSCTQEEGCACKVAGKIKCYVEQGKKSCVYKSLIVPGRTYLLSFWAKGKGTLTIKFSSAPNGDEFSKDIFLSPEWTRYTLGPVFINWDMDSDDPVSVSGNKEVLETFEISGFTGDSYLDNILLKEVRSDLFLIKPKLWHVPKVCDEDYNGNYAPQYMLGCQRYHEKVDGNDVYLRSFAHLCQENLVGCEPLIDTFNTKSPFAQKFNVGDPSEIDIPADKPIALVNDSQKVCSTQFKGCMAVGLVQYKYNMHKTPSNLTDDTDDLFSYQTKYLINDPDNYTKTLCQAKAVGCDKFTSDQGNYYFHNPLAYQTEDSPALCEYKSIGSQKPGWYIVGTQSGPPNCPLTNNPLDIGLHYPGGSCLGGPRNGEFCAQNSDCPGGRCFQWAGLCPGADDSCTQYVDPLSTIGDNVVFNGDFSQDVNNDGVPDGWTITTAWKTMDTPLYFEPHTLYTLVALDNNLTTAKVELYNCTGTPAATAFLTSPDSTLNITSNGLQGDLSFKQKRTAATFYTNGLRQCNLRVSSNVSSIKIYKAGVYYYLDKSLDKGSCKGEVHYEHGCVLFNKRSIENEGNFASLTYDAAKNSKTVVTPQNCSGNDCNANILLKVQPDRTCGDWLYCKSLITVKDQNGEKKKVCTELGLCDSLDSQGNCNGFPIKKAENVIARKTVPLDSIRDVDGYAEIGELFNNGKVINGDLPFSTMTEKGQKIIVPNGSFELVDKENFPVGWLCASAVCNKKSVKVITDPVAAQQEGLPEQAPDGRNFLKMGALYALESQQVFINDINNSDYFLEVYLNTFHLLSGKVYIQIEQLNGSGNIVQPFTTLITANIDNHWQHLMKKFVLANNTVRRLVIKILASPDATGNFYVDNIKITPVLQDKKAILGFSDGYIPQTCRAYPKVDSLSCNYIDQNGIREVGWKGYCLLHDLPPGNPKQCLLWYPLDQVKGSLNNEAENIKNGYDGKYPVYYALQATTKRIYEYRHIYYVKKVGTGSSCPSCPPGYKTVDIAGSSGFWGSKDECYCAPVCTNHVGPVTIDSIKGKYGTAISKCDGFYSYDGLLAFKNSVLVSLTGGVYNGKTYSGNSYAIDICRGVSNCLAYDSNGNCTSCILTGEIPRVKLYATEVAQTVTPLGYNKYWANRVYLGSKYKVPLLNYGYASDSPPFGSSEPPADSLNNPLYWDSDSSQPENQPLTYIFDKKKPRLGQPFQCVPANPDDCHYVIDAENDNSGVYPYDSQDLSLNATLLGKDLVERLFAQSYGLWKWVPSPTASDPSSQGSYQPDYTSGDSWLPPYNICPGTPPVRPAYPNDYCGVPPQILNIKANNNTAISIYFKTSGILHLTFNTKTDLAQLPLVRYSVDWGDGAISQGSGDRPDPANPHSLYHMYSYWDMLNKDIGTDSIACGDKGQTITFTVHGTNYITTCPADAPCCATVPSVNIQDNWGWCNNGLNRDDCGHWDKYGGIVIVTQY